MKCGVLVLASLPQPRARGGYIFRFLLKFFANLHLDLCKVWESRFPLILHYLEQTNINQVELEQDWLLDLNLNSVQVVASEAWSLDLVTALVDQLPLYNSISKEKSYCVILTGPVLTLVTQKQDVLDTDTLSLLFLVSVNRSPSPYMIGAITTQCFDPRAGPEECCG